MRPPEGQYGVERGWPLAIDRRRESLHIHSRFCAAAQNHCIFTVCRDIAKLDGSKLDFDPRLQEFFLGGRGGGNTAPENLSGAPGAQEGPPKGDPS